VDDIDIPVKFPIPFAASAGGSYIRNIPEASQIGTQDGAASLTDGFPPLNFVDPFAGGFPPFGQDFNGLLKQVTQWNQWQSAGGPIEHDATFATDIGGYPKGSQLLSAGHERTWISTGNANATDPDAGGAGWATLAHAWSAVAWPGLGTANAHTIALSPAATSNSQLTRVPLTFQANATNTGAVTLSINGLTAVAVQTPYGTALAAGSLIIGGYYTVVYTGAVFRLISSARPGFTEQESYLSADTWVCPVGVYRARVRLWGAGAGGGGGNPTGAGGGASGGGYSEGIVAVTPGASYAITVGAGGNGGSATANGTNGGASSFASLISATGGVGGLGGGAGLAGGQAAVGAGSGGTLNVSGGIGYGANGPFDGAMFGGTGGSAFASSISPSAISGTGAAGNAGAFPGGGASGGAYNFGGGNGGAGLVIVDW